MYVCVCIGSSPYSVEVHQNDVKINKNEASKGEDGHGLRMMIPLSGKKRGKLPS